MFKFLKRSVFPDAKPAPRRKPAAKSGAPKPGLEPGPLPEVTEGNEQSDWALWEDSVAALDSQMQSLTPSRFHESQSSDYQGIDPFSKVTKKDA